MKDTLEIALCALDIVWNDPKANYSAIEELCAGIEADILVLPEMFPTGFTITPKTMAQPTNGSGVNFMKKLAEQLNLAVCGSISTADGSNYYNRFYWVEPNGTLRTYDKRHLFSFDNEHKVYTAGQSKLSFEYMGWNIAPFICYDLRFPVWSRNVDELDLYLYVAHWPKVRDDAWRSLLKARAIENLAYVAGVNRSGKDKDGKEFSGFSTVFNAVGQQLGSKTINPYLNVFSLSKSILAENRSKFPFLNDMDKFTMFI